MDKKRLTNDKMTEEFSSVIDDLIIAIKVSGRRVFDIMVEKTAQSTSDAVDKKVENLKIKIKRNKENDGKENSSDGNTKQT